MDSVSYSSLISGFLTSSTLKFAKLMSSFQGQNFSHHIVCSEKLSISFTCRLGLTKSNESKENSTTAILSPNSLLSFNLEPLTDTLETLELNDNGFSGLPMQFQGRSFARLRDLDLSHNPIKGKRANVKLLEW